MLKIGDFSKLTQVSVKTLHYYDEIGLLKPNQIDHSSGYRYYSIKQLPRLNRILAYKDLGFSLEQIAQLLDDNLSTEKIQGMLKLKQAEVAQLIEAEQARLKRIESRLRQIEQEDKLSDYVITTKRLASQRVLSVRKHLATYSELPQLLDELYDFAQQHKLSSETLLVTWHDQRFKEQHIDVEVSIPLSSANATGLVLPPDEQVKVEDWPEVERVVSTIHLGGIETLAEAYTAIMLWAESNDYLIGDLARNIYKNYKKGEPNRLNWTEVQVSVYKANPSASG